MLGDESTPQADLLLEGVVSFIQTTLGFEPGLSKRIATPTRVNEIRGKLGYVDPTEIAIASIINYAALSPASDLQNEEAGKCHIIFPQHRNNTFFLGIISYTTEGGNRIISLHMYAHQKASRYIFLSTPVASCIYPKQSRISAKSNAYRCN